jgi:hypothetical protein
MKRRQNLSRQVAAHWSTSAQYRFLAALMADPKIRYEQIAFHGGTSLHFSWRSPRLSEDLDFLMARDASDIQQIVNRAQKKVAEEFAADDPSFAVALLDKTKSGDRMLAYHLKISHPGYLGKALVKVEFWRVSADYLEKYPVALRAPIQPGEMVSRISNPVPAATLETAYCDKLTAFATRPYLKWRDIYDLWWIGTQTDSRLGLPSVVRQFLHNVSAYETVGHLSPARALIKFLDHDPAVLVAKADPDLKRWLPDALWTTLHPRVTTEMVSYVRYALRTVADAIEGGAMGSSLKHLPS